MKTKIRLLLVFLMSVLLVFSAVFASNAADAASVEEITVTITKNGVTTTKSCSFDSFMLEIDEQETALSENAVYDIVVNKDFQVGGRGYWEFRNVSPTAIFNLDLNGHTVTATKGNVFQIRTGYDLNIDGADDSGNVGTWKATGAGASPFFMRDIAGGEVKVNNLNIVSTNLSQSAQPVVHILIGDVYMTNVNITYTGANFPSSGTIEDKSIVKIGNGTLTLDNCVLEDKSDGKLKFYAINSYSNTKISLKNTEFNTYYGFQSKATDITIENSKITAVGDIFTNNCNAVITDSELITSSDKFSSTTGTVTFKYGTGKNSVTIASGSVLTDSYKVDGEYYFAHQGNGKYVLQSGVLEEITVTITKDGVTTTKNCSFDAFILELDTQETSASENTVYSVVVNKSFTVGGKGWWELKSMSPTATLNIDLNGQTVTAKNGNVVQNRTAYILNIDGADSAGNVGTWNAIGAAASMFYMQKSAGAAAIANVQNLNIVCTNLSQSSQPILHLQAGTTTMKNVKITYNGADFPSSGTIEEKSIIKVMESAKLVLDNCVLEDKGNGTLKFYGITASGKTVLDIDNTVINAYYGVNSTSSSTNTVKNSKISATGNVFLGSANWTVTDTEIITSGTEFTSSTGTVNFKYGTGKNSVTVANGSGLSGKYTTEDGYAFIPYGNGRYVLGSDEGVSTVKMTSIFADGMVFQREMPINVFGTCRKIGAEIKVQLGDETVIAVVDGTGNFKATFSARNAERGLTLTVEQLDVDVPVVHTYTNISVGEVIVISGQSNAAYELYKMEDSAEYIANADNYSNIKVFRAPRTYQFYEVVEGTGSWHNVDSKLLLKSSAIYGDVSAIGYVLATRMADALGDDIDIALVDATYAGAGIYSFIDYGAFVDKFGSTSYSNVQAGINRYNEYLSFYNENGRYPASTSEAATYVQSPYTHTPGVCYNTMVAPIEGYAARCVVWYQGETNSSNLKTNYDIFFDALKEGYKKAFANDDLKFFAIQLAPYTSNYNDFRALQYLLGEADDTFVISTSREGSVMTSSDIEQGYVHPARKSPIGHRLADSVLKNVYGFYSDEIVEAPEVVSVTADGNKLIITFDTSLTLSYGTELEGFEIAGADGIFKAAVGKISDNQVILTADGVDNPMYVRYGWGYIDFVLLDGTVIPYNPNLSNSIDDEKAIVIGPDGSVYTFGKDCGLIIESRLPGNLTNESGHPMPIFMLEVGYGA